MVPLAAPHDFPEFPRWGTFSAPLSCDKVSERLSMGMVVVEMVGMAVVVMVGMMMVMVG